VGLQLPYYSRGRAALQKENSLIGGSASVVHIGHSNPAYFTVNPSHVVDYPSHLLAPIFVHGFFLVYAAVCFTVCRLLSRGNTAQAQASLAQVETERGIPSSREIPHGIATVYR
jgi:hypothetical protein